MKYDLISGSTHCYYFKLTCLVVHVNFLHLMLKFHLLTAVNLKTNISIQVKQTLKSVHTVGLGGGGV